jgi:anaerobic ribonucleoside-triphosphate reductase
LNEVYPPEVRDAHVNGDMYMHDLGYLAAYCVGWDLKDLLLRGLGGVYGKVESKPAKHFRSALGQMVNFIFTMQGEAAGAQAFSSVDTYLAPFIRYDRLRYDEVKQAVRLPVPLQQHHPRSAPAWRHGRRGSHHWRKACSRDLRGLPARDGHVQPCVR